MDAAAELGRNPGSKHQIQPEYDDEQADAGQYCQTRLARPNSHPVDPFSCYMCDYTHTMHIYIYYIYIYPGEMA